MKILKFLDEKLEYIGMCITFVIMFFVVLAGIITRLVGSPLSWTEEASRLAFVWMIFLGLSYGTAHDKHIRVTIIPDKMGPKVAAAFTIFWDIVTSLVASIIPIAACLNILRCIQKLVREHLPAFKNAGKEGGK